MARRRWHHEAKGLYDVRNWTTFFIQEQVAQLEYKPLTEQKVECYMI